MSGIDLKAKIRAANATGVDSLPNPSDVRPPNIQFVAMRTISATMAPLFTSTILAAFETVAMSTSLARESP
jgi:hypothetical protein